MDDFFKQFRDNLDARPAPSFEEKDWRKLSRRLDRQTEKRPLPLVWWWIVLPLALLLLASNVLFFSELRQARQKITALETRQDTVYLTKVVYQTDTVFQTKIVRQTEVEYLPAVFASNKAGTAVSGFMPSELAMENLTPNLIKKKVTGTGIGINLDIPGILQTGSGIENLTLNMETLAAENLIQLHSLETKPFRIHWEMPRLPDLPISEKKEKWSKKFLKTIYAMRPKGVQAGAHAGLAKPMLAELQQSFGYSLGLNTAVVFSPRLQMWVDGDYFKLQYETKRMSEELGIPVHTTPNAEYELQSAEVTQRSFQFSAGMQCFFNSKGNWQPFVGGGYGVVRTLPYDVFYDFEHPTDPFLLPYLAEIEVSGKGTLSGFLLLRAGIERRIVKNWNWRLMATWRTTSVENHFPASRLLGLQTGLTVGF